MIAAYQPAHGLTLLISQGIRSEMLLQIQRRIVASALDTPELGTGFENAGAMMETVTQPGIAQAVAMQDIADIDIHAEVQII